MLSLYSFTFTLYVFYGKTMTSSRAKRKLTFTADGFGISLFVEKAIKRGKTPKETTAKKLYVVGGFCFYIPITSYNIFVYCTLKHCNPLMF